MKKIIICALFASVGTLFAQHREVVVVKSPPPPQQKVVVVKSPPPPQRVVVVEKSPPPPRVGILPVLNAIIDGPRHHDRGHNDHRGSSPHNGGSHRR